jgi:teichoic acid transport system ATP-binding protein
MKEGMFMDKVIEIKNIYKKYFLFDRDYKILLWLITKRGNKGVKKALSDVTLTITKGEVVGIVGPNGAGKSTLMKIVAGITMSTSGTIKTVGTIGSLINLNAGFNPNFTGRQNIYYKGTLIGMKKTEIDNIIDDIIEFIDIGEYFDMPTKTYSSGMNSRIGFALAVFLNPDILIVDEVFAVGDTEFKERSREKTIELFKSGKAILFSSHSDQLIREFCHRVVYIDKGVVIFDGDVESGLALYKESIKKRRKQRLLGYQRHK